MEWISVKDKHFCEITNHKDGSYSWESTFIEEEFLIAIELKKGWCIEKVVLIDQIGLELISDGTTDSLGWEITDVTHWMKIEPPKQ